MDPVLIRCASCDARIGSLANLWMQIGKKYITPAVYPDDFRTSLKVTASGAVRTGDADTLIAGCELQEAECEKCHANLGQKCLKSPSNHVLNDGQMIFRSSSIMLKYRSDQRRGAEPNIQRVLKLREDREDVKSSQALDVLQIQTDLEAQRQEMQRIGATGFQVMSSFETAMARFEQQMKRLSSSVDSLRSDEEASRRDVDALKADVSELKRVPRVSRLDAQLETTDKVVAELRQAAQKAKAEATGLRDELAQTQQELRLLRKENAGLKCDIEGAKEAAEEGAATTKLYASEVSSLRREMKQLRSELASERSHSPAAETSFFSSHQLDILASNIAKIGHRASQIESLQMEFELFRTRVQRLEAKASNPGAVRSEGDLPCQRERSASQPRHGGAAARQKRPSMGGEDPLSFDATPSKRVAVSSDRAAGEEQPSSPSRPAVSEAPMQSQAKKASVDIVKTRRTTWRTKR